MVKIFTTPSCSSCRKSKKWLSDHKIEYKEKNIFNVKLTQEDIYLMLGNSFNGFDDIISRRSKIFMESNLNIDDMTMSEITEFIIENPSVLRRPIMIENDKMQVGYNEDEIRVFIPKRLRELIMKTTCDLGEECVYERALNIYIDELSRTEVNL